MTTYDFLLYASRWRDFEMDVSMRKETSYGFYTYGYAIWIDGRISSINVNDGWWLCMAVMFTTRAHGYTYIHVLCVFSWTFVFVYAWDEIEIRNAFMNPGDVPRESKWQSAKTVPHSQFSMHLLLVEWARSLHVYFVLDFDRTFTFVYWWRWITNFLASGWDGYFLPFTSMVEI